MKVWLLLLGLAACGAGDDTVSGTRGNCGAGGALTDCPDSERTAVAACWRLVDCGAIPLAADPDFVFDWPRCVDSLETQTLDRQRLIINCIAASTCDALIVDGSPDRPDVGEMHCLRIGGR